MPTVKIELLEGKEKNTLIDIQNIVMNSVIEALRLPDNDRNIRLIQYKPDFFIMKQPYEILIEINMFSGRTRETKKKLYNLIVNNLDNNKLIAKEKILITLNEQPLENWSGRGGIPADEMDLGFKVKI